MGPHPASPDTDSYDAQFLLCLCLILLVVISLGLYIIKLNAEVDHRREVAMERLLRCNGSDRLSKILPAPDVEELKNYCRRGDAQ